MSAAQGVAPQTVDQHPLLDVQNLEVHFPSGRGLRGRVSAPVRAVDGVSFTVSAGETVGLVGESGCGKSTTGRAALRLIDPTGGRITFDGTDITRARGSRLANLRRNAQMVFQDPYSSLDPRMRIGEAVAEPLVIHGLLRGRAARRRAGELLEAVGLSAAMADQLPHEFSGGQRQRIAIARALALEPRLLVCDEPISALDVSIQAQVINMLDRLQQDLGLAYLFIAHDLAVVRHLCHRIAVMYLGTIVETGPGQALVDEPLHPYTRALVSAVPRASVGNDGRERIVLEGEVPSPTAPPPGCRFNTRCPFAQERCRTDVPALRPMRGNRLVACHYAEEIADIAVPSAGVPLEGGRV